MNIDKYRFYIIFSDLSLSIADFLGSPSTNQTIQLFARADIQQKPYMVCNRVGAHILVIINSQKNYDINKILLSK